MSELVETPQMDNSGHVRIMSPELCAFLEKHSRFHRRGKNEKEKIREEPNSLLGTPCWIWRLATSKDGYGVFRHPGQKTRVAHRIVWALVKGPIPEGKLLLHAHGCRDRACVNPDHLRVGTYLDNSIQAQAENHLGLTNRGENSPGHKLTDDEAREIRRKYKKGVVGFGYRKLAKEYSVGSRRIGPSAIRSVVLGLTWAHLLPETFQQSQKSTSGVAADKGALAAGLDTSNVSNHWETVYSFSVIHTTRYSV
jgi:hypothetical protein